ncbi:hypothetical protein [Streptomyces buecherae]|uniref:hypothetical protein n=1 Tax=Streptomyces buecherae TaxID=2763006 RepID=UPI001C9A573B|nr:hypothetical protein [Streptomyces buecherae]
MRARRLTRRTGSGTGAGPASRRGRTTIAALAVAGLAACTALTGCGSDDGSDDKTDKAGGGKSSESPETPGAGADQSQVVQTAYEKTAEAETAKMRLVTKTSAGSKDVTVRGEGVIDFDDGASKLRLSGDGKQLEQRVVDGVLFQQPPKEERKQIPGGKQWIKVDLAKVAERNDRSGGDQISDPAASAQYTKAISDGKVKKLGSQELNGVRTTRYQVSIDVDKLAGPHKAEAAQLKKQFGRHLPMELWLDDDGRIRRQQMELTPKQGEMNAQRVTARTVIDFTDYGTDAEVEAPPRGQTADVTNKLTG